ncbi:MAG TPA: HIT family protein [Candidatus Bilamarchaeum sp.]|nr:HIT family protein [Candidatus Bilamarchaeum sp.]
MDCIFCLIAAGTIPASKVWEDKGFIAFLDINPISEGHTLVVPKAHSDYVFELDDEAYDGLFRASKSVAKLLKKSLGVKRVGVIVEGFLVPHAHVHLIPMNSPSEFSPARARRATPAELEAAAKKIRNGI